LAPTVTGTEVTVPDTVNDRSDSVAGLMVPLALTVCRMVWVLTSTTDVVCVAASDDDLVAAQVPPPTASTTTTASATIIRGLRNSRTIFGTDSTSRVWAGHSGRRSARFSSLAVRTFRFSHRSPVSAWIGYEGPVSDRWAEPTRLTYRPTGMKARRRSRRTGPSRLLVALIAAILLASSLFAATESDGVVASSQHVVAAGWDQAAIVTAPGRVVATALQASHGHSVPGVLPALALLALVAVVAATAVRRRILLTSALVPIAAGRGPPR